MQSSKQQTANNVFRASLPTASYLPFPSATLCQLDNWLNTMRNPRGKASLPPRSCRSRSPTSRSQDSQLYRVRSPDRSQFHDGEKQRNTNSPSGQSLLKKESHSFGSSSGLADHGLYQSTIQSLPSTGLRNWLNSGQITGLPLTGSNSIAKVRSRTTGNNTSEMTNLEQKTRYCFGCHSVSHWTIACTPELKADLYKCGLEHLSAFAVDAIGFEQDRGEAVSSTEMLVSHMCYAARRLNYYESFATKRDALLSTIVNECATFAGISDQFKLARLNFPPYEAYISKSCRLAHRLVRACGYALKTLETECIHTLVKPEEFDADPNARSKDYLVPFLQKHFHQLANDTAMGLQPIQLDFSSVPRELITYNKTIDIAWEEYENDMYELAYEWQDLESAFDVWKSKRDQPHKVVLGVLPFSILRAKLEPENEFSLRTVRFPRVMSLKYYTETLQPVRAVREDVKIADDHGFGSERSRGFDKRSEILEKENELYKKEAEVFRKENEVLKKESETLQKENGILRKEIAELKKAIQSQATRQITDSPTVLRSSILPGSTGSNDKISIGSRPMHPNSLHNVLRQMSQTPSNTMQPKAEDREGFPATLFPYNEEISNSFNTSTIRDANQDLPVSRHRFRSPTMPDFYSNSVSASDREDPPQSLTLVPRRQVRSSASVKAHLDSRDEGECTDQE